jgi:hypothetical protein
MQYLPVTLHQMRGAISRFARSSLGDAAAAYSAGFTVNTDRNPQPSPPKETTVSGGTPTITIGVSSSSE